MSRLNKILIVAIQFGLFMFMMSVVITITPNFKGWKAIIKPVIIINAAILSMGISRLISKRFNESGLIAKLIFIPIIYSIDFVVLMQAIIIDNMPK